MIIDRLNADAVARRREMPATNTLPMTAIDYLPEYYGWVECDTGTSKFVMFQGGDDGVAAHYFWNGHYERTTMKLWCAFVKTCEFAIDIGAHTGVYTLAAKSTNPDISVAAFEPNPMNFSRFRLNLRANMLHQGNAFMMAVVGTNSPATLSTPANSYRLSSGGSIGRVHGTQNFDVEGVSLDQFIPRQLWPKLGLIKIDTEGCEARCIYGGKVMLSEAKPAIFFECIHVESGQQVEASLKDKGYKFYEIDDLAETILPVDTIRPYIGNDGKPIHAKANRVAIPKASELP